MKLIDADALHMILVKMKDFGELTAKKAIRVVENAPTIDAEPVRHGKWISHGDCGVTECSCCGWNIEECVSWNYCPNCGADMRGEEEWTK